MIFSHKLSQSNGVPPLPILQILIGKGSFTVAWAQTQAWATEDLYPRQ